MQSIVLAYDDTPSARGALESAGALASAFDAKLTVTSVAPVLVSVGRSGGLIDSADPPERHAQALEHARSFLRERGVEADYVNLIGPPAETIVRLATRRHADLIVVGSRRPSLAKRLFGQSVSESVMHKARCPVLVVCEPTRAAVAATSDEHRVAEPLKTRERIAA
jgi:nucleotide-binding universal stress UspA family protein